jgi:hypothetical protein
MTTCDKIRPRLTAYLDGELADDHGSVVRGHLRECAACRQIARDEAVLRDGLRTLAPIDPPATLWAGVQAQLAAAEVADARKPRWRRQAMRWARWSPTMPQLATAGLVAAAAVAMLTWRSHIADEPSPVGHMAAVPPPPPDDHQAPTAVAAPTPTAPSSEDVTADLSTEPARTTARYDQVVEELMKLAVEDSARWSADARAAFDRRIAGLREAIAHAGQARSVQRAQRSMIRFLQDALVRDDIVLASGGMQ